MRILCPTDFSPSALNAIEYAANFAKLNRSELILYYAIPGIGASEPVADEDAVSRLDFLTHEIRKNFGIDCYADVEPSGRSVAAGIADKGGAYDLIIMGTNGADDFMQVLTGTNAYKAVTASSVPLIIIPVECRFAPMKNVVFAFDILRERKLPFSQLELLLGKGNPHITVLQVLEPARSEVVEQDLEELKFIISTELKRPALKFDQVHAEDVALSIHTYMVEKNASVLALCTIERNVVEKLFRKSIIKQISAMASYPVLVFHR